eukprot:scaffold1333_cov326-Ochromonas_danica.AAC.4
MEVVELDTASQDHSAEESLVVYDAGFAVHNVEDIAMDVCLNDSFIDHRLDDLQCCGIMKALHDESVPIPPIGWGAFLKAFADDLALDIDRKAHRYFYVSGFISYLATLPCGGPTINFAQILDGFGSYLIAHAHHALGFDGSKATPQNDITAAVVKSIQEVPQDVFQKLADMYIQPFDNTLALDHVQYIPSGVKFTSLRFIPFADPEEEQNNAERLPIHHQDRQQWMELESN